MLPAAAHLIWVMTSSMRARVCASESPEGARAPSGSFFPHPLFVFSFSLRVSGLIFSVMPDHGAAVVGDGASASATSAASARRSARRAFMFEGGGAR